MRKIINWVKDNPNRSMFLLPIILVAGISISHVVSWYDIANPFSWAIYLSIAIEVGAMTALVAATNKIKGGVWFMFGLITLIQMIGNIFFSYKEIDGNGTLFKSWVELTGPLWEMMGSDPKDVVAMKRWLAFLEGGLLPVISLTSLHFFVKYEKSNNIKVGELSEEVDNKETLPEEVDNKETLPEEDVIDDARISQLTEVVVNNIPKDDYNSRLKRDAQKVYETIKKLKEEGKLPEPTEEDIKNEPTSLAFTPYEIEEDNNIVEKENLENDSALEETQTLKTLGEDLQKTWKKIIKRNNNIDRI